MSTSYPIIPGPDNRVMDDMHRIAKALLKTRPRSAPFGYENYPTPTTEGAGRTSCLTTADYGLDDRSKQSDADYVRLCPRRPGVWRWSL